MSFFKRLVPLEAEMRLQVEDLNVQDGAPIKGLVSLESKSKFKVESVRLEIRVMEKWRERRGLEINWVTETVYSQDVPIAESFDMESGGKRDFPFEVIIPMYQSTRGQISYSLKAVANVKGRPDLTNEVHPTIRASPVMAKKLERKQRSIEILKKHNVPYIEHFPVIEHESEIEPRTVEDIANRAMCLCLVAFKGVAPPDEPVESVEKTIHGVLHDYELEPYLSPAEKLFIENKKPNEQERKRFSWRFEAYWVLLWALGYVEKLEYPDRVCDASSAKKIMRQRTREKFISDAKLRPYSEIFDEADLIYRLHWAVVEADLRKRKMPANLNPDVVYERHYALNWLIRYGDSDWDDVDTST